MTEDDPDTTDEYPVPLPDPALANGGTDDVDEVNSAILEYFLEGRGEGEPWGKATPSEVYRGLEERDVLDELDNPVRQTVQNRIQRLALAGHLENKYDTGSYGFVNDPREGWAARGKRRG